MTPKAAVQKAIEAGYTSIKTFIGLLPLTDWLEMTSLLTVEYENGRLVTNWLPSILEPGKMERLSFILQ